MKILLVAGGTLSKEFLQKTVGKEQFNQIICIDGGANILTLAGINPDILVGDFDSINHEILVTYLDAGIEMRAFQKEKDMTDTELAIIIALELGADEIVLLGATGTRLDHTLSNIFLLSKFSSKVKIKIQDENNQIMLFENKNCIEISQSEYHYVSLLPISTKVTGVTTRGLKYPLEKATLDRDSSFGISNELNQLTGSIYMDEGILALILSND